MSQRAFTDFLLKKGLLDEEQIHIARQSALQKNQPLSELCVELGFLSAQKIRDELSEFTGWRAYSLERCVGQVPAHLSLAWLNTQKSWVLEKKFGEYRVLLADPFDLKKQDELIQQLGHDVKIEWSIIAWPDLYHCLNKVQRIQNLSVEEKAASLYSLESLLKEAVDWNASDVHFEPEAGFLRIRQRIDGVLHPMHSLAFNTWPALCSRIKVFAGMDIADSRSVQEGRFSQKIQGEWVDFRASTLPTQYGENVVLRLFIRNRHLKTLKELGFDAFTLNQLDWVRAQPEGLALVCGATGSGKTTTLYALLDQFNQPDHCLMTLEDPVECPTALMRQVCLSQTPQLSFATGIRALLRQDPDTLLIGEIRDEETAHAVLKASLTGHRVFSTLHAGSVWGAFPRLATMGISPMMLIETLHTVMAQRLLRRLCRHCAVERPITEKIAHQLQLKNTQKTLFHAVGCPHCRGLGYSGRFAVAECLITSPAFFDALDQKMSRPVLETMARDTGWRPIWDIARDHLLAGETSLAECERVFSLYPIPPSLKQGF